MCEILIVRAFVGFNVWRAKPFGGEGGDRIVMRICRQSLLAVSLENGYVSGAAQVLLIKVTQTH